MAEGQPSLPLLHLTQVSFQRHFLSKVTTSHLNSLCDVGHRCLLHFCGLWFQSSGFFLLTGHLETLSVRKFLLFWPSLKGCVSLTPQSFQEFCSGCLPLSCFAPPDSAFIEFGARIPKSEDTSNEDAFCYWCSGYHTVVTW